MAKFRPIIRQWTGLNTKGLEDGRRGPESINLQNARIRQGAIKRRPGMVRLDVAPTGSGAIDFDGSADYVTAALDTRVWALGTKFTIRAIIDADSKTGTRPLLYAGTTTPSIVIDTASSKLRVRVWDSSASLTTVTSTDDLPTDATTSIFFTRDGATLSLQIDNGTADTGSMDADKSLRTPAGALEIARDGTNYFDGTVDSLDVFRAVLPTNVDRLCRWPDPMLDDSCVASYEFTYGTPALLKDLSRFRNHGYVQSSPSKVSALAHNPAPVWAIEPFRSRDRQRLLVHAGASAYIAELT